MTDTCYECLGTGWIRSDEYEHPDNIVVTSKCCTRCKGRGEIEVEDYDE